MANKKISEFLEALSLDIHYEQSQLGSRTEYTK